jgi:hypothetical protein
MAWARVIPCDVSGGGKRQGVVYIGCVVHKRGQSNYVEHIGGVWAWDAEICEGHPLYSQAWTGPHVYYHNPISE